MGWSILQASLVGQNQAKTSEAQMKTKTILTFCFAYSAKMPHLFQRYYKILKVHLFLSNQELAKMKKH